MSGYFVSLLVIVAGVLGFTAGRIVGEDAGFKHAAFDHCEARGYASWFVDRERQIHCLTHSGHGSVKEEWPGYLPRRSQP